MKPCVVLVERSMLDPQNSFDEDVLLRVFEQPA